MWIRKSQLEKGSSSGVSKNDNEEADKNRLLADYTGSDSDQIVGKIRPDGTTGGELSIITQQVDSLTDKHISEENWKFVSGRKHKSLSPPHDDLRRRDLNKLVIPSVSGKQICQYRRFSNLNNTTNG